MSSKIFAQEYLAIPSTDDYRFFPPALVDKCCILQADEYREDIGNVFLGVDLARMGEDKSAYVLLQQASENLYKMFRFETTRKT